MSTSYDIRCLDPECGVDDKTWDGQPMRRQASTCLDDCRADDVLLTVVDKYRASLENCGEFLRDPAMWWFTDFGDNRLRQLLTFLADHHGHELAVFDEYGARVQPRPVAE